LLAADARTGHRRIARHRSVRSQQKPSLGGTETELSQSKRRLLLIVVAILLGIAAQTWTFLPPISMLGWWAFLYTGGPIEQWWYELPEAQRQEWYYDVGMGAAYVVLPLVVAGLFLLYTRRLWNGDNGLGPRTWIPAVALLAISAWYIWASWQYALKYQGIEFMTVYLAVVVGVFGTLTAAYRRLFRNPSWRGSLLLHAGVFAWLVVLAFPWLGEYI